MQGKKEQRGSFTAPAAYAPRAGDRSQSSASALIPCVQRLLCTLAEAHTLPELGLAAWSLARVLVPPLVEVGLAERARRLRSSHAEASFDPSSIFIYNP
jgi:hypothetical protein